MEVTADELRDEDSEEVFVPLVPEMFCIGPTEEDALLKVRVIRVFRRHALSWRTSSDRKLW